MALAFPYITLDYPPLSGEDIYIYRKNKGGCRPGVRPPPGAGARGPVPRPHQCSATDRSHCFPRQQHSVTARISQARLYNKPVRWFELSCVCGGRIYKTEELLFYLKDV